MKSFFFAILATVGVAQAASFTSTIKVTDAELYRLIKYDEAQARPEPKFNTFCRSKGFLGYVDTLDQDRDAFIVCEAKLPFDIGDKYELAIATRILGGLIERRILSEDEQVYIHKYGSVVTWFQGPKKDHVYLILGHHENLSFNPPSLKSFYQRIEQDIERYIGMRSDAERKEVQAELSIWLYTLFELTKHKDFDFHKARYFHFEGEAAKWLILYSTIQRNGVAALMRQRQARVLLELVLPKFLQNAPAETRRGFVRWEQCLREMSRKHNWAKDKSIFESCRPTKEEGSSYQAFRLAYKKLQSSNADTGLRLRIAIAQVLEPLDDYFVNGFDDAIENFERVTADFNPKVSQTDFEIARRIFLRPNAQAPTVAPLLITHGTSARKLANILQLEALTSYEYALSQGITKTFGGEYGHFLIMDGSKVSFWGPDADTKKPKLLMGFGRREGLEYPISFAASQAVFQNKNCSAYQKELRKGEAPGEVVVDDKWPLECIDYIFAPWFAISEISEVLKQHQLERINVVPYTEALLLEYNE